MLRSLRALEQFKVSATDGEVGNVVDFFFDDEHWSVRHLIVNTGGLFDGRHVLISPISFREVEWSNRHFHLALTVDKIKDSPNVDTAKPVSRQHEQDYYGYYGYPHYWDNSGPSGMELYPDLLAMGGHNETRADHIGDVHLRSVNEVRGYSIQGNDGAFGHVEDFIVDDQTWTIRYLVAGIRNWFFGKKVLIAPRWATRVSWEERKVFINLPRSVIKGSPQWNPTAGVNRDYEELLHKHYGQEAYWTDSARPARPPSSQLPPQHPGSPG
jgi:hypothetical protein